jgi:hypothetical protein
VHAVYSAQCTLYTVHNALYTVKTMYSTQCTVHSAECIEAIAECPLPRVCTHCPECTLFSVYSAQSVDRRAPRAGGRAGCMLTTDGCPATASALPHCTALHCTALHCTAYHQQVNSAEYKCPPDLVDTYTPYRRPSYGILLINKPG